jgi:hypothetical protein
MIPGISSGDLEESKRFLDRIRNHAGYKLAIFYDWEHLNPSRKVVSPTATLSAAKRLIKLCEVFQKEAGKVKQIDILAHSAGTVVVNKTAVTIASKRSSVRLRNVLLLGTALGADEHLDDLLSVSESVLNVHSAYDKINRNINDQIGELSELKGETHRNLRMDHTLGGRIMRHYVFLSYNPENWVQYGYYLRSGQWPEPRLLKNWNDYQLDDLHRLTLWVKEYPDESPEGMKQLLPDLLSNNDKDVKYYGVILAGLLKMRTLAPAMKAILEDEQSPVYLRKDVYQALGNLEDGHHVYYLKRARKLDPPCGEEIRDVLRALKRKRVEPIR